MASIQRNLVGEELERVKSDIVAASSRHPNPSGLKFRYGTAGFRMKADLLDSVVFRVGLIADLLSRQNGSGAVGVMITASHNPPADNGVKIIDPTGGMIEVDWEKYATDLVNQTTDEDVAEYYFKLADQLKVNMSLNSKVLTAYDSRSSSVRLNESIKDGVESVGGKFHSFGLMTTPQLHYLVSCVNDRSIASRESISEDTYYNMLIDAFVRAATQSSIGRPFEKPKHKLVVDCASGVGGPKMQVLKERLADYLDIELANASVEDPDNNLNVKCGADFVKTKIDWPRNIQQDGNPHTRYASLDGDADRVVYYCSENGKVFLLDGDRIACLFAYHISHLLQSAGVKLNVGVVQTAYANGASTDYVKNTLGLEAVRTNTGVKNLHHAAMKYDIGIYFEANGHGTILFNESTFEEARKSCSTGVKKIAMDKLEALKDLSNQTVGDALSDLLLVEATLIQREWDTLESWKSLYNDRTNILAAVPVANRELFVPSSDETILLKPEGIQSRLEEQVAAYGGRAFIRPSGTENVVRIYVEANDLASCQALYRDLQELLKPYQN